MRGGLRALSVLVAAALGIAPLGAAAQSDLREAPAYFVTAVFEMSTAQSLARSCLSVSIDPVVASKRAEDLLALLEADGFSTDSPFEQMQSPEAAIRDLQMAFVERHAIDAPDEARVCEIARAEMAEATGVGTLLVEVPE